MSRLTRPKSRSVAAIPLVAVSLSSFAATAFSQRGANAIYISPGQCIMIGTQQVCATNIAPAPGQLASEQVNYICRYGLHADSEIPNIKSYALVQSVVKASGAKAETVLKNFGTTDKDKEKCEAAAEAKEAKAEAAKK